MSEHNLYLDTNKLARDEGLRLEAAPTPGRNNHMKTKNYPTLSAAEDGKSGDHTQNGSIRRKWFALSLGGFLFTSIFALSAPSVEAECKQWSVGHGWQFKQGSGFGAIKVDLDLHQNGTVITGTASHLPPGNAESGISVRGTVDGTVEGDQFAVKIEWNNSTTGVYEGTIGPSGKIEGKGWEIRSPRTRVRWYSETRMVCADAAPAAPTPKVLKSTGKARPATPTPTAPPKEFTPTQGEAGKSTRPYIRALPQIVSIPRGESEALTKLVWFAGNDHPDARLVVEVNGGDEQLVDPQRKGSRQVKVKAGQKHVYTLSDGGEPLASVVVQTDQSAPPDRQRLRGEQRERPQDGESDNDENQGDE